MKDSTELPRRETRREGAGSRRGRRFGRALSLALVSLLAVVLAQSGSAKPPSAQIKLYQVCLTAGDGGAPCTSWDSLGGALSAVTGSHPELQITLHNDTSSNQALGSVNLTVPPGLGLTIDTTSPMATNYSMYASTSTSDTLQLRNLNLATNASVTVAFFVNASSTSCNDGTWGIQVKQSNDFNGSGNDFSQPTKSSGLTSLITGGCHLAWASQPASAKPSETITDTPFTQSGANVNNVAVEVQNANNRPIDLNTGTATMTISGDGCGTGCTQQFQGLTSTTFQGGRATFPGLKSAYTGTGFTATVNALGLQSPVSSPSFLIQQNGIDCDGLDPCPLDTQIGNLDVNVDANGGNFLFVAVNSSTIPSSVTQSDGGCAYFKGTAGALGTTPGFVVSDGRTDTGTVDITISIPTKDLRKAYGPNYGQPNVPICVGAKRLVGNEPVDCNTEDPSQGFADRTLDPTTHTFNGGYAAAKCGHDGYWWGILGTFQDPNALGFKTFQDPTLPPDPGLIPLITGWGSSPDGLSRTFTIHQPANWDGQFGC